MLAVIVQHIGVVMERLAVELDHLLEAAMPRWCKVEAVLRFALR